MLVAYVFNQALGANNEGDVVQMEPEEAQPLVDAGILAEASEEHIGGDDGAEEGADVPDAETAAVKRLENAVAEKVAAKISAKAKPAVLKANVRPFAEVKQPVIKSLSDLLRCQYKASKGNRTEQNRLYAYEEETRKKTTPLGQSTTNADGGYSIIPQWAEDIFVKVRQYPQLIEKTNKVTLNSLTYNMPTLSESSLADGVRHGGIQTYNVTEGDTATASHGALSNVSVSKNTFVSLVYFTNQILEDNAYNLDKFIEDKVGLEMTWTHNEQILNGTYGVMNTPALVTVSKEGSQTNATVNYQNVLKMYNKLWGASRPNAVWLCDSQVYGQFLSMTYPNASGTVSAFGGLTFNAGDEFKMYLFGRPIIECPNCAQLGNVGDILLVDLSQLTFVESPGMEVAISTELQFATLQTAFRFVRRFNVKSPWESTIANKGASYSWAVALQGRGT